MYACWACVTVLLCINFCVYTYVFTRENINKCMHAFVSDVVVSASISCSFFSRERQRDEEKKKKYMQCGCKWLQLICLLFHLQADVLGRQISLLLPSVSDFPATDRLATADGDGVFDCASIHARCSPMCAKLILSLPAILYDLNAIVLVHAQLFLPLLVKYDTKTTAYPPPSISFIPSPFLSPAFMIYILLHQFLHLHTMFPLTQTLFSYKKTAFVLSSGNICRQHWPGRKQRCTWSRNYHVHWGVHIHNLPHFPLVQFKRSGHGKKTSPICMCFIF